RALTLDRYAVETGRPLEKSLPLDDFVRYGQWFQQRTLPDLDPRNVMRIERDDVGFQLTLEDGDTLDAANVVIATGIGSFAHRPAPFASMPNELVSHTSDRI